MSNQYINFFYDPTRQGFDTESWSLISGNTPVAASGIIAINASAIYHYGDILRGDITMLLYVPTAPTSGDSRVFGLYHYGKGSYLTFNISGTTFTASSSDGTNTNSVAITWQSSWTAAYTKFRIKWEAGLAHFFVGGVQQAVISDTSITGGPMSLYIANNNADNLNLQYIDAKGIQSYYMNTPLSGSITFGRAISKNDTLTISESITALMAIFVQNLITDTATVTESVSLGSGVGFLLGAPSKSEALTVTESVTLNFGAGFLGGNSISDALTVTESVTTTVATLGVSVNEAITFTDFVGGL